MTDEKKPLSGDVSQPPEQFSPGKVSGTGADSNNPAPFTDVNQLPIVSPAVAQEILAAAMQEGVASGAQPPAALKFVNPDLLTKPGVERWTVKTGQDSDIGLVAKNIIGGASLGVGIVPATVAQLIRIPRPPDMTPPTSEFAPYESKRRGPVEFTVWQVEGSIIFLKLEADGDYHMVLQGSNGEMFIIEVPTPTSQFVGSSPWLTNIKAARDEVDSKFVSQLSPRDFVASGEFLVPRERAVMSPADGPANLPRSFCTPREGEESSMPLFMTAIKSTPARITGVGFFDKIHGQTGVAQLNGIELHPVLKIEWL